MKVCMELAVGLTCPVDGEHITVSLLVRTDGTLMVEDLREAVSDLQKSPMIQEDFSRALAKRLALPVKTVGTHSGVTITCEAP